MKHFDLLPQKSNVILYGAGTNGIVTKKKLERLGFNIGGFIDIRANEIGEIDGIPVWNLDDPVCCRQSKAAVVLITVKNVFEHQRIVEQLISRGFENLLYKPYSAFTGNGSLQEIKISDAFDKIIKGESPVLTDVPCTDRMLGSSFQDRGLIADGDEITFWAPVALVYTNKVKDSNSSWTDINCAALFPHIELFRFFSGDKNAGPHNYLTLCIQLAKQINNHSLTEQWKKNIIQNRYEVFQNMEHFYNIDSKFFIRNAPQALWNERGYFNLTGGKHRVTYLISKGYSYIPLKVSKEDYHTYLNLKWAEALQNELVKQVSRDVLIPVMHPYFYEIIGKNNSFYQNFLIKITGYLAEKMYRDSGSIDFHALSVADALHTYGLCSRYFHKMGCTVYRLDTVQSELTDTLDHLFYSTDIPRYSGRQVKVDYFFASGQELVTDHRFSCRHLILLVKNELKSNFLPPDIEAFKYMETLFTGIMNHEAYSFCLYQNKKMEDKGCPS